MYNKEELNMHLSEAQLVTRAREYLSEKVLDLADVPRFIELLVKVWDEYHTLQGHLLSKDFDLSDVE